MPDASSSARETAELLDSQNRVLELIARGAPLRETLDVLLSSIQAHCPGMLGSVLLLDPDGVHVRHGAAPDLPDTFTSGVDGEPIGPQAGSCGTAAFRRQPVIVEDIATDLLWDHYRDLALRHGLRACWSTPIFNAEQQVLGTFAMYFRMPGRPDAHHLRLIGVATHIASIAIGKHRSEEEIRRHHAELIEAQQIASLGSYEWDLRTGAVYRSEELCRIFGCLPPEFEPTYEGYLSRVHPEDRASTRAIINQSFATGKPFDFEERIVRPDGTVRMLHSQGQWTFDESRRPVRLVGICRDITERKHAEQQMQALSARLISAQEEERGRLARELHDDLSQEIAALSIAATNLKKEIGPGDSAAQTHAERIQQCLIRLADSVRALSHTLHPATLEYSGLGAALESYCSEFSELTGTNAAIRAEGSFRHVPAAIALCVYRVAQEALQNVRKHAHVDRAEVTVTASPEAVCLTVSDNGAGFDPLAASPGLGLVSMRERARLVNGVVNIASGPDRGTTLTLTVPIPSA